MPIVDRCDPDAHVWDVLAVRWRCRRCGAVGVVCAWCRGVGAVNSEGLPCPTCDGTGYLLVDATS